MCRSRTRCAPPARSSASIRCTWQTKGRRSSAWRRSSPASSSTSCAGTRSAGTAPPRGTASRCRAYADRLPHAARGRALLEAGAGARLRPPSSRPRLDVRRRMRPDHARCAGCRRRAADPPLAALVRRARGVRRHHRGDAAAVRRRRGCAPRLPLRPHRADARRVSRPHSQHARRRASLRRPARHARCDSGRRARDAQHAAHRDRGGRRRSGARGQRALSGRAAGARRSRPRRARHDPRLRLRAPRVDDAPLLGADGRRRAGEARMSRGGGMTNIRTEIRDNVGVLTIDRRERFNSLDADTARDLRKAGLQLARDASVRAAIVRGEGGVFCSGADLKEIRAARHPERSEGSQSATDLPFRDPSPSTRLRMTEGFGDGFKQILEYIHSTISEIRRAPKPFIAAVDGVAAAGGFGLAMSCDLVIASERATFEWAYAKTGLTAAESSTFFLPRLVGFRRAMELLFLNPRLDARQAMEYGLVTPALPVDGFDDAVFALAQRLAGGPTEALGIAKNLINDAALMERLDLHLDRELDHLARIADGDNFAEGIAAFFEKRAPAFGAK